MYLELFIWTVCAKYYMLNFIEDAPACLEYRGLRTIRKVVQMCLKEPEGLECQSAHSTSIISSTTY